MILLWKPANMCFTQSASSSMRLRKSGKAVARSGERWPLRSEFDTKVSHSKAPALVRLVTCMRFVPGSTFRKTVGAYLSNLSLGALRSHQRHRLTQKQPSTLPSYHTDCAYAHADLLILLQMP